MKPFRLDRRTVIRGAGSIAIGLPWLECMVSDKEAAAQTTAATAKRFIAVYQPGGTVMNKFTPSGTEAAPVLSPILAPLEGVKSKINIIQGLTMQSAVGEQHQAGIIALLTGTEQNTPNTVYAHGPSIDQVLAGTLSMGKPIRSLELAIRWATGKSHGRLHPINSLNFENNATWSPIPPRIDPQAIWDEIFGKITTTTPTDTDAIRIQRKRSILDFVDRKYVALGQRIGAKDRVRLQEHLQKIRDIEGTLVPPAPPPATCMSPTKIDTSKYNPRAGVNSADDGSVRDTQSDAAIPEVGKFMMDMLVMAMACDRTAVASLQWSDTEAKHTFPWLSLSDHHHFYQHDGGFRAAECEKIATWYSQMHFYMLDKMSKTVMGADGKSLLDESVVFFGSEIQKPDLHQKDNMPFILAGNGGGMKTGRWLKYNTQSHNNLLVSIFRLFGDNRATFGNTKYSSGPLNGPSLTG